MDHKDKDDSSSNIIERREQNAKLEATVWRKLDMFVVPIVTMYYLLSFLDRVNLGNARIAGLQKDLKITNHQYSIALTVTYVPYIVIELPSNLLLKRVGAHIMLPTMVVCWGLVTTLQGFVNSYSGLLACRFFLGLCEGGLFPGLLFYLSFFYPRHRLQGRVSMFFCGASLAAAFSGLLAYGIVNMHNRGGRPGWSWIFILEGLFTVVFGLITFPFLPRSPKHARFLSKDEKDYIEDTLASDGAAAKDEDDTAFDCKEVKKAMTLPHVVVMSLLLFTGGTVLFSTAYFTPSIIVSLGHSSTKAQLMSVPPFAAAFAVATVGSFFADKYRCRGPVLLLATTFCIVGYSMFYASKDTKIRYGSLFFSVPGIYLSATTACTWLANNVTPHVRRATALAFGFAMSNVGGILATWLLGSLSPPPHYRKGTLVLLSFGIFDFLAVIFCMVYFTVSNKRKERVRESIPENERQVRMSEEKRKGDGSAFFIYTM